MKKRKSKFAKGSAVDTGDFGSLSANVANTTSAVNNLGAANLGDTGPQGNESITSFKDNYVANFKARGKGNFIPGAQILNTLQTVRDTNAGNAAMGIKYKPPVEQQGSDSGPMVCPPGQVMQGGTCVQRLSKGGEFSFNKVTQQDYYKDVL
jgi:hypothetical protein